MFDDFYEVFLADSPAGKECHYAIRYEVYCQEKGFLDKCDLKQEQDEYDQHAIHFSARNKSTGQWVGTLRIVPRDGRLIPMELHCQFNEEITDTPSHRVVEMSRLGILKEVRKQTGSHARTDVGSNRRVEQSIMWGLIHAGLKYSEENDIKKWYSLSPLAMERILNRAGFNTHRVSEVCNYKGERVALSMLPSVIRNCSVWQDGFSNGYRFYSELETNHAFADQLGRP